MCPPRQSRAFWAHSSSFLVEGLQSRRTAGAHIPIRAVPTGLSPADHFDIGLDAELPLEAEPKYRDSDFAVRTLIREGVGIEAWRQQRMHKMLTFLAQCDDYKAVGDGSLS